jgi:hypothetical protein
MDEFPVFEIRQLCGLERSEMSEVEDMIDLMDSGAIVTTNQTIELPRLLSKAIAAGGSASSVFSPAIITLWRGYRLSEAYGTDIFFTNHSKVNKWWQAV